MKRILTISFALAIAGNLLAADAAADFSAANKLYAQGKFAEAASAYDAMLHTGQQSPELWFNAGNAEFKAGHVGKAIAAYRQAALLSPRDAELRANLAFVRSQVSGPASRRSGWQSWLEVLTLNEGTRLTATLFWLLLALLAARQIRPALAPKLRTATRLALTLTVLSGAVLSVRATSHFHAASAVVTSAEATARSGPYEDGQSVFTARDGTEFSVLDRHGDWVQVANRAGKIGWLSRAQVTVLPDA